MDDPKEQTGDKKESTKNEATKQNIPAMEVHHHAHAETHGGPKKVKHYFFEFFMLFLAVFAGSVAEYFLEHLIERKREKQYIVSMIEDLRVDTSNMSSTISNNKELTTGLDTLMSILDTPAKITTGSETIGKLYLFNRRYTGTVSTMEFSNRTLSQLKNGGNMRLIHDVKVSDSIMNYDQNIQQIENQKKAYMDLSMDIIKTSSQIFNNRFIRAENIHSMKDFMKQPFNLLTNDTIKLIQYNNMIDMNRSVIRGYCAMLEGQQETAKNLISFLQKEYHLSD